MSMFQKLGFIQSTKTAAATIEAAPYVTRTPEKAVDTNLPSFEFAMPKEEEVPLSFGCLDDLFGDMIEDQHPLALSKW